jgi:hypothetical protein
VAGPSSLSLAPRRPRAAPRLVFELGFVLYNVLTFLGRHAQRVHTRPAHEHTYTYTYLSIRPEKKNNHVSREKSRRKRGGGGGGGGCLDTGARRRRWRDGDERAERATLNIFTRPQSFSFAPHTSHPPQHSHHARPHEQGARRGQARRQGAGAFLLVGRGLEREGAPPSLSCALVLPLSLSLSAAGDALPSDPSEATARPCAVVARRSRAPSWDAEGRGRGRRIGEREAERGRVSLSLFSRPLLFTAPPNAGRARRDLGWRQAH